VFSTSHPPLPGPTTSTRYLHRRFITLDVIRGEFVGFSHDADTGLEGGRRARRLLGSLIVEQPSGGHPPDAAVEGHHVEEVTEGSQDGDSLLVLRRGDDGC
jgi:hypothetical protein